MNQPEPLWGIDELATFLDVEKSWIYDNWRKLGIPTLKIGQKLKFKPSAVVAWVDKQEQQPPAPRSRW
jgi:hypothetical protein